MNTDVYFVALTGTRPHRAPQGVCKPPIQVLPERKVTNIRDESTAPGGYGLGELLCDCRPSLAVDVAILRPLGSVHRVLSYPATILAPVDTTFAVSSLPTHPAASSMSTTTIV